MEWKNITKRTIILHPIFFAAFIVLFLYSHNISQVLITDVPLPLVLIVATAVIAWIALGRILKNYKNAAVFVSAGTILFFSYGHIHDFIRHWTLGGVRIGQDRWLLPVYALVSVAVLILILKRKRTFTLLTNVLNTTSILLVLLSAGNIVYYHLFAPKSKNNDPVAVSQDVDMSMFNREAAKPDVYFIILDGYAADETLESRYHYDNTPFLDSLRELGFQVPAKAFTNYNQTVLALASIMDMDYVDHLQKNPGEESSDYTIPISLIKNGRVWRIFRSLGYHLNLIRSGWGPTDVNKFIGKATESRRGNEFLAMIARTTVYPIIRRNLKVVGSRMDDRQRAHKLQTFEQLKAIPGKPGANFTLAHIVSPHPPYLFGPKGESVQPADFILERSMGNISWTPPEQYIGQLQFVNLKVLETIREVIGKSEIQPVILILADHGPATLADWETPSDQFLNERHGILYALRLPGASVDESTVATSVNSFRYVFNYLFDAGLDTLQNRIIYCNFTNPYRFHDITGRLIADADSIVEKE